IGIPAVLEMASSLGIHEHLVPDLSLALGSSETTLVELTQVYTTFAAGGKIVKPIFILEVRDRTNKLLQENVGLGERVEADPNQPGFSATAETEKAAEAQLDTPEVMKEIRSQVDRTDNPLALPEGYGLDPMTAYLMTDLLRAVVQEGTGIRAKALG